MSAKKAPRWWEARLAANRKPTTYRCPLCGELLPALSQHMLLFPEGDHSRRRHAHTECVMQARERGELPTREEFERKHAPARSPGNTKPGERLKRLFRRSAGPAPRS